jgi:hypothetical protein
MILKITIPGIDENMNKIFIGILRKINGNHTRWLHSSTFYTGWKDLLKVEVVRTDGKMRC